jgi:hypothetical protein
MLGICGALWGIGGVVALLGFSVVRLSGMVLDMWAYDLRWYHWGSLVLMVVGMAYSAGYRGFQCGFAPRTAARARYLYHSPRLFHVLLAPAFCMGYFYTHRRRQIAVVVLTIGILLAIGILRFFPQPWRGIVDAGVVVGLTWGLVAVLFYAFQAFTAASFAHSPEVPEQDASTLHVIQEIP